MSIPFQENRRETNNVSLRPDYHSWANSKTVSGDLSFLSSGIWLFRYQSHSHHGGKYAGKMAVILVRIFRYHIYIGETTFVFSGKLLQDLTFQLK
jgi:hypothetical protein